MYSDKIFVDILIPHLIFIGNGVRSSSWDGNDVSWFIDIYLLYPMGCFFGKYDNLTVNLSLNFIILNCYVNLCSSYVSALC